MTFLENRAVTVHAASRYRNLVHKIPTHAELESVSMASAKEVDLTLSNYINNLFFEGEPTAEANATLAAVEHIYPDFPQHGIVRLPRTRN